jgi:hypothetical protein
MERRRSWFEPRETDNSIFDEHARPRPANAWTCPSPLRHDPAPHYCRSFHWTEAGYTAEAVPLCQQLSQGGTCV